MDDLRRGCLSSNVDKEDRGSEYIDLIESLPLISIFLTLITAVLMLVTVR